MTSATPPTHLISLEAADMNGDGKPDLVSVRMDVYQPFTKDGRVVLWLNHWGQPRAKAEATMKPESSDDRRGYDKASLLKLAGLAVALGVATWLLAPLLLPVKLPADFPKLPDLRPLNPDLRALLQSADQEARRQPGSAEAVGKLGMAYHANLFLEQAEPAYRIAARLAPNDYHWAYCQASCRRRTGTKRNR